MAAPAGLPTLTVARSPQPRAAAVNLLYAPHDLSQSGLVAVVGIDIDARGRVLPPTAGCLACHGRTAVMYADLHAVDECAD